jgi:hypothetical protein
MRKPWVPIAAILAAVILPPLVLPVFIPWSEINCEHEEINIRTGQARYSRSLWFAKISERVEDTALSHALNDETVSVAEIEAWHRVNTFYPGVHHSPHYRYHAALYQANQFERLRQDYGLNKADAASLAREVLIKWQTNRSDSAVGDLLQDKMIQLDQDGPASESQPTRSETNQFGVLAPSIRSR